MARYACSLNLYFYPQHNKVFHDLKVSFQDYTNAVTEQPLLLEAFGQILPSEGATVSFLSTLQS